jgi:hypothetical protein
LFLIFQDDLVLSSLRVKTSKKKLAGYYAVGNARLDVCGSLHHSTIHKEKIQQDATVYQNFIIPYLYEAQHVLGYTPPIIRSLKVHWQPLVFHT